MTRIDKYVVVREIGRGGMGVVYEARDPELDRPVALKLLNDRADPKRFLIEARAAAKVLHTNLVPIFDLGEQDGRPFLVMELVNGVSAAEFLAKRGALRWKTATRIVAAACRGLAAIHEAGLVHRDVKPSNLLISKAGVVKVADFGLARMVSADGPSLTGGQAVGTPHYMSPEQCMSEPVDARSDVYALGVTYFVLLTGRPPYHAEHELQIMFAHCNDPVPDPRSAVATVPATCAGVIRTAMAKSPSDRYQSAREMLAALEPILAADRTEELVAVAGEDTPSPASGDAATEQGATRGELALPGTVTPHGRSEETPGPRLAEESNKPDDARPTRRRWLLAMPALAVAGVGGYFALRKREPDSGAGASPPVSPAPPKSPVVVPVRNVGGTVGAVAVSDDGRWLAVGLVDEGKDTVLGFEIDLWPAVSGVKLFDRASGGAAPVRWQWRDAPCSGVAFSPDGQFLAAAGGGTAGELRVWNLAEDQPVPFGESTFDGSVRSVAFSPDGRLLAAGVHMNNDRENVPRPGVVRVWDVESRSKLRDLARDNHPARRVVFAPDNRTLAVAMAHGELREPRCELWDATTGGHVRSLPARMATGGPLIAFSRSEALLAVGAKEETTLYRPPSFDPHPNPLLHAEPPGAMALSADGSLLAIAFSEVILLWQLPAGPERGRLLGHKGLVTALAFTDDGRTLISAAEDRTVREFAVPAAK